MTTRFKDANEALMAGVASEVMKHCLAAAQDFAPAKVVSAKDLYEEFMEEWFEHHLEEGLQLPWEFPFKIRMGELTVWTGIEKSGKTTLLNFVQVNLMAQGERVLLASFETKAAQSLKKMSKQAWGGNLYDRAKLASCLTEEERQAFTKACRAEATQTHAWLSRNLWVYRHVGIGRWRELLEDMGWARRRHGITQFVVDNFMRLGVIKDDYAQQAELITAFANFAIETQSHVHMVVHQNKSEGHKGSGGKRTVSGAFEIIANAHNIVEVQRDEKKGEKVSELFEKLKIGQIEQKDFSSQKQALDLMPDGKFVLHAQRDGDHQNGSKYLWFLWQSQQYADKPPGHKDHTPTRFVAE